MTFPADCPICCVVFDQGGTILDASAEGARILGYEDGELVGKALAAIMPLAARVYFQTHVAPQLALDARVDEIYLTLANRGGDRVPVVCNTRGTHGGTRLYLAFIPTYRRAVAEDELLRACEGEAAATRRIDQMQAQLAISERMASIGELAATIAHELNNPLTYVSGNVELLAAEATPGSEQAATIAEVQLGVARIRNIVASMKKLSRIDALASEPVDLGRVVEDALKLAGNQLRHRTAVEVSIDTPVPIVRGDEARLGQIVVNLLTNATQALPADRQRENRVTIEVRRTGDVARIIVSDNGPGIPANLRARIFEPFFTTKPIGQGTGLGLSVCQTAVRAMNGVIRVESEPGDGARFIVELPLSVEVPVAPIPRIADEAPAVARQALKLLAIDDDHGVGRIIGRALRGHEVEWFGAPRQAWERFERDRFAGIDVVLCDVMMPEMTGIELYQLVASRAPEIARRFVFLTGGAFTPETQSFIISTTQPTIAKPFDLELLRATVRQVAAVNRA